MDWTRFLMVKKKSLDPMGHLPVSWHLRRAWQGRSLRPQTPLGDPVEALGSRLRPHCLRSAVCRRRLRLQVLQAHASLAAQSKVWKVPHGPD